MASESGALAARIAEAVTATYGKLPRRAIPDKSSEWTNLAGFVVYSADPANTDLPPPTCVSLATGTKCAPRHRCRPDGRSVHDCHAEILARRALERYLLWAVGAVLLQGRSHPWLERSSASTCRLRPGIQLALVSTTRPCGDSCIQHHPQKTENDDLEGGEAAAHTAAQPPPKRRRQQQQHGDCGEIQQPAADWRPMTGARRLHREMVFDKMETDDSPGVLRLKPGRGDPAKSFSCSDKMSLWTVTGCQGRFAAGVLSEPIFLSRVVLGEPFDEAAMQRALVSRVSAQGAQDGEHSLHFSHVSMDFKFCRSPARPIGQNRCMWWTEEFGTEFLLGDVGRKDSVPEGVAFEDRHLSKICRLEMLRIAVQLYRSLDILPADETRLAYSAFRQFCSSRLAGHAEPRRQEDRLFETVYQPWRQRKQISLFGP